MITNDEIKAIRAAHGKHPYDMIDHAWVCIGPHTEQEGIVLWPCSVLRALTHIDSLAMNTKTMIRRAEYDEQRANEAELHIVHLQQEVEYLQARIHVLESRRDAARIKVLEEIAQQAPRLLPLIGEPTIAYYLPALGRLRKVEQGQDSYWRGQDKIQISERWEKVQKLQQEVKSWRALADQIIKGIGNILKEEGNDK